MNFSAAILLLSPATTTSLSSPYLLLPLPPQILTWMEIEAGWGHGTSSVIFKIKDFFWYSVLPISVGACVLPRVSAVPTSPQLWAALWENLYSSTVLFTYLTPPTPTEGHTPLFLPPKAGPFLPLSKPSSRKPAGRDSLPVWRAAGEVWGEGRWRAFCCDSCKKEGGHLGSLNFPLLHTSVYSQGLGIGTLI